MHLFVQKRFEEHYGRLLCSLARGNLKYDICIFVCNELSITEVRALILVRMIVTGRTFRQVHRRLLGRRIKSETAWSPIPWASDIAYMGCFCLLFYLIIEFLSFQVYLDEITSSNICNSVHCRLFYSMLFTIYISRIQWLWHLVSCVPGSFLSLSFCSSMFLFLF